MKPIIIVALCCGSKSWSKYLMVWNTYGLSKGSLQGMQSYRQCREEQFLHRNTLIVVEKKPLHLFQELGAFVLTYCYCKIATRLADGTGNSLSHGKGDIFAKERGCGSDRRCSPAAGLNQPRSQAARGPEKVPPPWLFFEAGVVGSPVVWVYICHWHKLPMPSARPRRALCALSPKRFTVRLSDVSIPASLETLMSVFHPWRQISRKPHIFLVKLDVIPYQRKLLMF